MIDLAVYKTADVEKHTLQAALEGVDVLSPLVDGITVARVSEVTVPQLPDGRVNVSRVGMDKFDRRIPLHLFVLPIWYSNVERSGGYSYFHYGVGFINSTDIPNTTRVIATHEIAHGLGYALPGAPQSTKTSNSHCSCTDCVMYPEVVTEYTTITGKRLTSVEAMLAHAATIGMPAQTLIADTKVPENFCAPCRADIRDTHEDNLEVMMRRRAVTRTIISKNEIREAWAAANLQ